MFSERIRKSQRSKGACLGALIAAVLTIAIADAAAQRPDDALVRDAEARVKSDPQDFMAWNRLGDLYLQRYRELGAGMWLTRAEGAAQASLKAVDAQMNPMGLGLQARVDLAGHRFSAARKQAQEWRTAQPNKEAPLAILIDALLESGDLSGAEKFVGELEAMDAESLTTHSRIARLAFLKGDLDRARKSWEAALSAVKNDPSAVAATRAWCWIQLGELAFRVGRWSDAETAYQSAMSEYPNWWSGLEHLAELRGAQGKNDEAAELFERAAKATDRPELWQSLGDLQAFYQRPDAAKASFERALKGYQESIARGETLYVHHFAGYYSDSQENAAEAVKWARKDLEERQTPYAWDSLGWALYRHNEIPEALELAKKVVASGLRDSHLIYHAAMIHMSAGEIAEGQKLLRHCAEINPHFNAFHVHR